MTGNKELYQALFTKNCSNKEKAEKLLKRKSASPYSFVHYALLANYGGEPFSAKQARAILEVTPICVFNPGTTIEEILENSVRFGILRKLD